MQVLTNRRYEYRRSLAQKIWYRAQGGPFTKTESLDISLGGIRFVAKEAFKACDLLLRDSRGRFVSFRAEAVWRKRMSDGKSYEVGMSFRPVSTSDRDFKTWMETHVFS